MQKQLLPIKLSALTNRPMPMKKSLRFTQVVATMVVLLLTTSMAVAQTPDTISRKPSLPTGPPLPPQPQRPQQPRPEVLPAPPVVVTPQARAASEDEPLALIDRLYYGGSFGLQFGTYTNISLLPILGYRLTEKLSVGTGLVYQYVSYRRYSYSNFGVRGFAQAALFNIGDGAILAHAEAEVLNAEYSGPGSYQAAGAKRRDTVVMPMVGLGYRQRIGDRASFDFLVLYNTNDVNDYNPYSNPVFRAGVNIPFRK